MVHDEGQQYVDDAWQRGENIQPHRDEEQYLRDGHSG